MYSAPTALDGRRCIVVTGRALKSRVVSTGPAPGPSTPPHGDFRHLMLIRALAVNPRDLGKEGPVSGVWTVVLDLNTDMLVMMIGEEVSPKQSIQ